MIIQALKEFSDRNSLAEDPAFEPGKPVNFVLVLDNTGKFLNLEQKEKGFSRAIPFVGARNSGEHPRLLVDTPEYLFGGLREESQRKLESFLALLQTTATKTEDARISAVQAFYESQQNLTEEGKPVALFQKVPDEWGLLWSNGAFRYHRVSKDDSGDLLVRVKNGKKGLDFYRNGECVETPSFSEWSVELVNLKGGNVAFQIYGSFKLLFEEETFKDFWRQHSAREVGENSTTPFGVCLSCGKNAEIEEKHRSVFGVPGGNSSGAKLISADKQAFTSYNQSDSKVSPLCKQCADGYVFALNHLLKEKRQHYRIDDGTVACYWNKNAGNELDLFEEREPEEVRKFVEKLRFGINQKHEFEEDFFSFLTLSGNAGRVIVRDFIEISLMDVRENLLRWFDDIRLISGGEEYYPSLVSLIRSLEISGSKSRQGNPASARSIFNSMIGGSPVSRETLAVVLRRIKAEREKSITRPRISLIKLIINRLTKGEPMSDALNAEHPSHAYHLGRLFALLEHIQEIAHGQNLNTTIKDRFFASAASSPFLVFPRLIQLSSHHLSKGKKDEKTKGTAHWLDRKMGDVMQKVGDSFPRVHSLEEQGIFAIGYYHQREARYQKQKSEGSASQEGFDQTDEAGKE